MPKAAAMVTPAPKLGLRERNKIDKLNRIQDAAKQLFESKGYDNTTAREIASLADVGLGTLFTYVADKRDLLFLIINDDIEAMTSVAEKVLISPTNPETMLNEIFRLHYVFFSRQASLSRFMLREQQFYDGTAQARRFQATRAHALELVKQVFRWAKASGQIATDVSIDLAARLTFGVYQMELRDWLVDDPRHLKAGMEKLDQSLALLMRGFRSPPPPS